MTVRFALLIILFLLPFSAEAVDLTVSPERSLKSLEDARDAIRKLPKLKPVTVWFEPGIYPLSTTFRMDAEDSGTPSAAITYRAREPGKVIFTGAVRIAPNAFSSVSDASVVSRLPKAAKGHVVQLDLKAAGIKTLEALPDSYSGKGSLISIYCNDDLQGIARWPNGSEDTTMGEVTEIGEKKGALGKFLFKDPQHLKWNVKKGVWLSGFWRTPWSRTQVRVKEISATEITLAAHLNGGIGSKYDRPNKKTGKIGSGEEPYCALNLLEELDVAGEWSIDFETAILYWWPPVPLANAKVEIADLSSPMVAMHDVNHVSFQGFRFEKSLGKGFDIKRGNHITVAGCTFRNLDSGIHFLEGTNHVIRSNDLFDLGGMAIDYSTTENKETPRNENSRLLKPDGHLITNNHIRRVGQASFAHAVAIGDVRRGYATSCVFSHNLLAELPAMGVRFSGNENVFEFNEIHNAALSAGDVGGFYINLRHTAAGNVIRQNLIHHCQGLNAIYLDDGACGTTVTENIVYKADVGGWISGGRSNSITKNIFIECAHAAEHIDDRGIGRGYGDPKSYWGTYIWGMEVPSVDLKQGPWLKQYPQMGKNLEFKPGWPVGNVLGGNVLIGNHKARRIKYKAEHFEHMTFVDSHEFADGGFEDLKALNFRLKADSPIHGVKGFPKIEVENIGLFVDEFPDSLPEDPTRKLSLKKGKDFDSATDLDASNKK